MGSIEPEEVVGIRLHVYLSKRGIGSRRSCEDMIRRGRVSVNGVIVREMGVTVDPERDVVMVDQHRISAEEETVAIAFHKPAGVLSTCRTSREGAPAVTDFVDFPYRLYPAGRLDKNSTGLLILTNDGELALRITHPRYQKEKEYRVRLKALLSRRQLAKVRAGIELEDGLVRPKRVWALPDGSVGVIISEGRKRLIRRMFQTAGNPVRALHRTRIGTVLLGNLEPGSWRKLSAQEILSFRLTTNP